MYVATFTKQIVHVDSNRIDWLVTFSPLFPNPSANVDYTPRGPFEITFPAGSTRQEYTVDIIDDFLPENSEFFNADIVSAGPVGVDIGEPRQPVIEIQDTVDGRWQTALTRISMYVC